MITSWMALGSQNFVAIGSGALLPKYVILPCLWGDKFLRFLNAIQNEYWVHGHYQCSVCDRDERQQWYWDENRQSGHCTSTHQHATALCASCVKLHQRDERTNERKYAQRDVSLCPLCLSRASILLRGTKRDASWKFTGDKIPGSTNKYTKFGQLIIRKIIKILPPEKRRGQEGLGPGAD